MGSALALEKRHSSRVSVPCQTFGLEKAATHKSCTPPNGSLVPSGWTIQAFGAAVNHASCAIAGGAYGLARPRGMACPHAASGL